MTTRTSNQDARPVRVTGASGFIGRVLCRAALEMLSVEDSRWAGQKKTTAL